MDENVFPPAPAPDGIGPTGEPSPRRQRIFPRTAASAPEAAQRPAPAPRSGAVFPPAPSPGAGPASAGQAPPVVEVIELTQEPLGTRPGPTAELVPLTTGRELAPADTLRRTTRVTFGALEFAVGLFARALDRAVPPDLDLLRRGPVGGPVRALPAALVGLGIAAERRVLDVADLVQRRLEPVARTATRLSFVRRTLDSARQRLDEWSAEGEVEQRKNRLAAEAFSRAFIRETVVAVLDNLDVSEIIDRIDLNAIIDQVDLNQVIDRVDLNAVIDRLDLTRVIDRVDFDQVLAHVDLPEVTSEVLEAVNIGEIIRESTGSVATESMDAARSQSMRADRLVATVVDRILFRRQARDTALPNGPGTTSPATVRDPEHRTGER